MHELAKTSPRQTLRPWQARHGPMGLWQLDGVQALSEHCGGFEMTTSKYYTPEEIESMANRLVKIPTSFGKEPMQAALMLRALASQLAAQKREGDAWRGIDTAPKTGEIIILGLIDDNRIMVREGRWEDARKTWTWPWVSGLSPNLWMSIPQPPSPDQDREVSP